MGFPQKKLHQPNNSKEKAALNEKLKAAFCLVLIKKMHPSEQ